MNCKEAQARAQGGGSDTNSPETLKAAIKAKSHRLAGLKKEREERNPPSGENERARAVVSVDGREKSMQDDGLRLMYGLAGDAPIRIKVQ